MVYIHGLSILYPCHGFSAPGHPFATYQVRLNKVEADLRGVTEECTRLRRYTGTLDLGMLGGDFFRIKKEVN